MNLPVPDPGALLVAALVAFVIAGLMAPFETLGWWAGWFGAPPDEEDPSEQLADEAPPPADAYVVFLSGIHSVAGKSFAPRERAFLARLREDLPRTRIVEVFPYSVTNRALTGQRVFARFWRFALAGKLGRRRLARVASMLINLRNAWQVAVSADRRYGPMYDEGSADLIHAALARAGWRPETDGPIVLIGYSGGGQIALGAAGPLSRRVGRAIELVSLGGVMASPRSLDGIHRLVHLRGRNDHVARIGAAFFPGRWPFVRWSTWNRARAEGRVEVVDLGPMDHTGRDGYLDDHSGPEEDGSYLDVTVGAIVGVLRAALDQPS